MTNSRKLKRLNISNVDKVRIGNKNEFEATVGRFTEPLDMKEIGCGIVELKPGKKAWPYHLHYGNDEMFIILKGKGIIRYDDLEYDIDEGDVIYTPSGEGTAHQIINNSANILQYFAVSTARSPETCYYPDSKKYGTYFFNGNNEDRQAFIASENSGVDYYCDEEKKP